MDPKSIVCEHFRAGQCTKGHKCKYSHDLNVERKTAKAAVFDEEGKEVRRSCALLQLCGWRWPCELIQVSKPAVGSHLTSREHASACSAVTSAAHWQTCGTAAVADYPQRRTPAVAGSRNGSYIVKGGRVAGGPGDYTVELT